MMEMYQGENFFSTCDAHWDGMNCFSETNPGDVVKMSCPYYINKYEDSKCECEWQIFLSLKFDWVNFGPSKFEGLCLI